MADAFRGLKIRLGADARPLNSAINSVKSAAQATQKQLNAMNKALKFDPANVSALSQRVDLVGNKAILAASIALLPTRSTRWPNALTLEGSNFNALFMALSCFCVA